jgi:hypothetical protein
VTSVNPWCSWLVPLSQITDKERSITTARVFSAVLERQLIRQRLATCSLNAGVLMHSVAYAVEGMKSASKHMKPLAIENANRTKHVIPSLGLYYYFVLLYDVSMQSEVLLEPLHLLS